MKTNTTNPILIHQVFCSANGSGRKRLLQAAACMALMALAALNATAGTVTMTASDTFGQSSFNAAGHWDSGTAPTAGNDYFSGPYIVRSPNSGTNQISFAGDSLTVSPGGALYAKLAPLYMTVNILTNNGRVVNAQGGIFTVLGNMYTDPSGGGMDTGSGNSSVNDSRTISNAMTISGSGPLTNYTSETAGSPPYWQTARGTVIYTGNNTAFTGPQIIMKNTAVRVSSQANLGGNPASFNPAQLLLDNGVLQPTASFSLNNPNSGITIGAGGGSFNIPSGLSLTNANALAGAGTLALTNTGTLVHLGSAANFTGTLAVNGGTFVLGTGGSLAGANTIMVGSAGTLDVSAAGITLASGQTLAGVGSVVGTVTAGIGSQISPAGAGVAGTLGLSALTLSGGATLAYDFLSTNDVIAVSNNVTPSGVTTIQLVTVPANGTYTLITLGGTLGGSGTNFHVAALFTRTKNYALSYASSPNRLVLTVSGSGSAGNLVWQGDGINNLWDINTSSNWLNGANSDVYYDADTVNFTDVGAANPPYLEVTVNPAAVNFNSSNDYTLSTLSGLGTIAGQTSLTKTNTGTVTLSVSNTYVGGTLIRGGVLKPGVAGALGSPAGATALASISGTGTLDVNGAALDAVYTNVVQINGNGSSATQGAIDNTVGGLTSGGGDIGIASVALLGNSTVSASQNWQIGNTGAGIIGNGFALTKTGNNYLYLKHAASNPLGGLVIAGGGVLFWDRADALGATATITLTNGGFIDTWSPASYNAGLTFANHIVVNDPVNGGAIVNFRNVGWNQAPPDTYNGSVTLNGPLTITNTSFYNGNPRNVDTFGKVTLNGNISGTGAVNVIGDVYHFLPNGIQGGNLVVFNGNNSYSGPTLVNNLVQLQISTANQSGGAYDVVEDGTLDVALAPGKPTIPMSSLTLESGSLLGGGNLGFTRLTSLSSTPVIYATNLVINAGRIIPPLGGYVAGQFPLVKYSGSIGGGGFPALTLTTLPTGVTAGLVDNAVNHSIDLAVTNTGMVWKGNLSSIWDIGATANWFNPVTSSAETYADGETVIFDDTASSFAVSVPSPIAPLGVTVNATNDYAFSDNSIGGGAALIKTGSGTLTISSTNNLFTGGTFITGGTIKLADQNYVYPYGGGALNNNLGNVFVGNGGTLDVNGVQVPNYQSYGPEGYNVYLSGAGVNGNGALVNNSTNNPDLADPGYVTLVGDATVGGIGDINIRHGVSPQLSSQSGAYTLTKVGTGSFRIRYVTTVSTNFGAINILQGIVSYESSSALGFGDPTKAITVGAGGGFAWGTAATACARPLICSNNATLYGYNTATNVFNGPVTLVSGNVSLNASNYNGMIFSNVLSGAGGVTLQNNSYATFAASNTYSGDTIVADSNAGGGSILRFVGNGSINSSPNITLQGITASQAVPGALDASGRVDGMLTLVSGQTLRGDNGSYVRGTLVASSGATITPGGPAKIQYMSVSNTLTLQAGSTVAMDVSLDGGATNDSINVTGTATYNGTLQLSNIGVTPLAGGNSFRLFKAGGFSGNFASIAGSLGPGLVWSFTPSTGIAAIIATNPPSIGFTVSSNQVTVSWPADHLGWILQAQTNSINVGLSTNWVDVPGTASVTQKVMTMNPGNVAVFYRLRLSQ